MNSSGYDPSHVDVDKIAAEIQNAKNEEDLSRAFSFRHSLELASNVKFTNVDRDVISQDRILKLDDIGKEINKQDKEGKTIFHHLAIKLQELKDEQAYRKIHKIGNEEISGIDSSQLDLMISKIELELLPRLIRDFGLNPVLADNRFKNTTKVMIYGSEDTLPEVNQRAARVLYLARMDRDRFRVLYGRNEESKIVSTEELIDMGVDLNERPVEHYNTIKLIKNDSDFPTRGNEEEGVIYFKQQGNQVVVYAPKENEKRFLESNLAELIKSEYGQFSENEKLIQDVDAVNYYVKMSGFTKIADSEIHNTQLISKITSECGYTPLDYSPELSEMVRESLQRANKINENKNSYIDYRKGVSLETFHVMEREAKNINRIKNNNRELLRSRINKLNRQYNNLEKKIVENKKGQGARLAKIKTASTKAPIAQKRKIIHKASFEKMDVQEVQPDQSNLSSKVKNELKADDNYNMKIQLQQRLEVNNKQIEDAIKNIETFIGELNKRHDVFSHNKKIVLQKLVSDFAIASKSRPEEPISNEKRFQVVDKLINDDKHFRHINVKGLFKSGKSKSSTAETLVRQLNGKLHEAMALEAKIKEEELRIQKSNELKQPNKQDQTISTRPNTKPQRRPRNSLYTTPTKQKENTQVKLAARENKIKELRSKVDNLEQELTKKIMIDLIDENQERHLDKLKILMDDFGSSDSYIQQSNEVKLQKIENLRVNARGLNEPENMRSTLEELKQTYGDIIALSQDQPKVEKSSTGNIYKNLGGRENLQININAKQKNADNQVQLNSSSNSSPGNDAKSEEVKDNDTGPSVEDRSHDFKR